MKLFLSTHKFNSEYNERFDGVFYRIRDSTGKLYRPPPKSRFLTLSVFGDTRGIARNPQKAAVSVTGDYAIVGENKYDGFAWSWVCPLEKQNRNKILDIISKIPQDVTLILEDFQFPNERYCYCHRCKKDRSSSPQLDIVNWRIRVIKDFWKEILNIRKDNYALTLNPDPFGQPERYGVEIEHISNHIEFLHFPVYCTTYAITYWLDILVPAILKNFKHFKVFLEIYAVEPPPMNILKAIFVLSKYNPDAIVLYDYRDKHMEIARLLKENSSIQKLIEGIKNPTFHEVVERIKSWI